MGAIISSTLMAPAYARPVSYPGGWTGMMMNNGDVNSAHIHYSPTPKTSVGLKHEYWRDREFTLDAVQVNNLLNRWNKKNSQANLYLKSGLGASYSRASDDYGPAGFTGMAADWENRRFFIGYENRYTEGTNIDGFYQQFARAGLTPYIGDYGDLHTWIMLQVEHAPENKDPVTVTPLIRLFKGKHLVEGGMNNHGKLLLNYVVRY